MIRYPVSQPCLGPAESEFVADVMRSGWLTQGKKVRQFEIALEDFFPMPHVVACSSGTAALHLALAAFGIGPGDEVLVPDLTFVATANAVTYTGAIPVLVDIDESAWTIDLNKASAKVTPQTRAIIPVHLYGVQCDMFEIAKFAEAHELLVIEDAAEAFGGPYPCGLWSDAAVYSFYANKVLTTGEGGAVVVQDERLAEHVRLLRGQGQTPERRYFHSEVGFNYRMTEMQAAIGLGQLTHVRDMIGIRRDICLRYREQLQGLPTSWSSVAAPWLYTCLVSKRDATMRILEEHGVETRPTFIPLHELPMYRSPRQDFPIASRIGATGISLPTFPDLLRGDVDEICQLLLAAEEANAA